jgi:MOSC domain-containing protein YiiM
MDLQESLSAADLGANLCLSGIPKLSHLPKGSIIRFPSGAELIVEEYNPPCLDMGKYIAAHYSTNSGDMLSDAAFSSAAKYSRGLVGVVEVPGAIAVGDDVIVIPYRGPAWANKGR